jgi:hypothetical protein
MPSPILRIMFDSCVATALLFTYQMTGRRPAIVLAVLLLAHVAIRVYKLKTLSNNSDSEKDAHVGSLEGGLRISAVIYLVIVFF